MTTEELIQQIAKQSAKSELTRFLGGLCADLMIRSSALLRDAERDGLDGDRLLQARCESYALRGVAFSIHESTERYQ